VVVTSRHRLARAVGSDDAAWPELLVEVVRGAIAGGADLVQVREPDVEAGPLSRAIRAVLDQVPGSRMRLVVNDRLDIALVVGAAGVHVPERSFGVEDVRRLVPLGRAWITGRSVHSPEAARQSAGASYLLAGTVRPSPSKPEEWGLLGWEGLRAVVAAAAGTPVVAIGGLTAADAAHAVECGATGIAAIGWFIPDRAQGVREFVQERVTTLRMAFDRAGSVT
jgi:thiamine-phosphate pyrophosphorylase